MKAIHGCVLLLAAACGGDGSPEMLPATRAPLVATGDPAGPAVRAAPAVENPFARNALAIMEGAQLYRSMNCAYCHGENGEGGMGPNLVDREWLFGDTPADRFVSVHDGRARGMPAYGALLPETTVWKIVAHLEELRRREGEPGRPGGQPAEATRESQTPRAHRK